MWSFADQAVASLGTLILSIVVAQSADVTTFGAFAAAIAVYALALTGSRAIVSMPYQMEAARRYERDCVELDKGTLGAALINGLLLAAAITVGASIVAQPLAGFLLVLAAATPFLLLQDAYRFILRQRDDSKGVALNDTTWTMLQVAGSGVIAVAIERDASLWHFAAWGFGVLVASVYAWRKTCTAPNMKAGLRFLAQTRRMGIPLFVEAFAIAGSSSVAHFAIAGAGGLSALAPIKGALVALGPVNVANGGLLLFITPMILRVDTSTRRVLLTRCAMFGAVITFVSLSSATILHILPEATGIWLLGETWRPARQLLIPTGLLLAAYGAQTAAMLGFRAYQITVQTMLMHIILFPLPTVAGVMGLATGGAVGAAWGVFFSAAAGAAALWAVLVAAGPRMETRNMIS
jgi:O-antigen/teichoic acid export membrane protein